MRTSLRRRLAVMLGVLAVSGSSLTGCAAGPVVTAQPSNVAVNPGQTATFTAAASGSPAPTVQWQVRSPGGPSFTTIPGATSPTLTISGVTVAMSGSQYQAVFTNTLGSAITSAATLSVTVTATRFVELIFSRSEITAADGVACQPNDTNIARLDTVVKPYLQSLGLAATGSIQTGPMLDTANWCSHYRESAVASWAQLQALGAAGWTFVTHSSTFPGAASLWSAMTPSQQWDETCGAAQVIDAHGLRGASDMYLWPNNTGQPGNINSYAQSHFVEPCFGTARFYGSGLSTLTQLATPTYGQSVIGLHGGSCNVSGAPCFNVPGAPKNYLAPANVIAQLQALQPGQLFTLQSYVLVTGTNPPYTTNQDLWDCTSSDPNLHWANDSERYCYSDWQAVVSYLASSGLGISQPGVVAAAAGRSGYSDTAITRP